MTLLAPANFMGNLILNLIFFNFPGALSLIVHEGIPSFLILYLVTVVYSLYLQMLGKTSPDEESSPQGSGTLYGTSNVVFVTEASSSVIGAKPLHDKPPSYENLVQAHKDHVQS